jgi:hypothetical protein
MLLAFAAASECWRPSANTFRFAKAVGNGMILAAAPKTKASYDLGGEGPTSPSIFLLTFLGVSR